MTMTEHDLVGGWRLLRWSIEYADGRPADLPFGADAEGLIVYAPDGWMTATMHERRRTRLSAPSVRQASLESRAEAMAEYLSYGGRWRLEGTDVVHDVLFSLNPVLIGTRQVRSAALQAGELHLSARESGAGRESGGGRETGGGRERTHRIVWRRAPV